MLHIFYKHLFGKDTAMKLINYSLKVGKKKLLENVNISFDKKYINHILGSNGAKDFIFLFIFNLLPKFFCFQTQFF